MWLWCKITILVFKAKIIVFIFLWYLLFYTNLKYSQGCVTSNHSITCHTISILSCLYMSCDRVGKFSLPATAQPSRKTRSDGQICGSETRSNHVNVTGIMNSWHNRGARGKSGNITTDYLIGCFKESRKCAFLCQCSLLAVGEYAQRQTDKSAPVGLIMLEVCGTK